MPGMTGAHRVPVARRWPRRSGAGMRRRVVILEVVGAAAWCIVGFHMFIDPMRRFEVWLATGLLKLFGASGISGILGDTFIVMNSRGDALLAAMSPSCSALTSLLALSALGFVVLRERPQSLLGFGIATLFVMFANQLRLVGSLLAARYLDLDSLVWFHDWVGAALSFCYTLGGLLIMIALSMHIPERAEQDRTGRHTARRPDAWAQPGLGYRVQLDGRPPAPRIRLLALIHRHLLPRRVSQRLGARRERRRIDYRIGHLDPERRVAAVRELAGRGLGVHTATLVATASYETDVQVLDALAEAVAARQWEPVSDQQIVALRLWARAWLMRAPRDTPATGCLVAVTGAGGPAGVAVIRALHDAGHRVLALDADPDAVGLRLADAGAVLPRADADGYDDALIRAVSEHRPAALMCTVAEEYAALYPMVERLAELDCATWLPPESAARTCLDKKELAAALHAAGVPHPPTTATRDTPAGAPGAPAQSRPNGREFTADTLTGRDGTLLTCVPRWRDATEAGVSVRGTTFDSTSVTRVVAAALRAVGLTGPANVRGFVSFPDALDADPDAEVEVTVVGINPRFSGGLPLTLAAGCDVVGTYLAGILHPEAPLPRLTFQPRMRMARYFAEVHYPTDPAPGAGMGTGERAGEIGAGIVAGL